MYRHVIPVLVGLIASPPTVSADDESERIRKLVKLPAGQSDTIQLPLRFHIVKKAKMSKKDVDMNMWLTPANVKNVILPEINRIWRPAKIRWALESVVVEDAVGGGNREKTLRYIANADRETPDRVSKIFSLLGDEHRHARVNNLYFIPYVGETSQGFAKFGDGGTSVEANPDGGSRCVVCVWTDKPSDGKKPPQKFALRERLPFNHGSIGRTCAHELGHNLLLEHPDKATQTEFKRLMGGDRKGYRLLPREIKLARRVATGRARTIIRWAEQKR